MATIGSFHFATRFDNQEFAHYQGTFTRKSENKAEWMFTPCIGSINEVQLNILAEKERATPGKRVSTTWAYDEEGNDLPRDTVDQGIVRLSITVHALDRVGFYHNRRKTRSFMAGM